MGKSGYLQYAKRLFFKSGASPLYFVFFVTTRCNARCRHCLLGNKDVATTDDLTLEEIEKVSAGMDDILFLLPTGGEPFLRKDLGEIIKIFYKNNHIKNAVVPSNGTYTERTIKVVRDVLESCPDLDLGIDISIDNLREKHDDLRGVKGLFEKATTTFRELRKLERDYKNLNVNIESTVSRYNQDDLKELYHYLVDELKVSTVFTLLTRGKPKDPVSKNFDIKKYEEYADILEHDIKQRILTGYDNFPFADFINAKRIVRHKLISKIVKENRYQIPCYAGNLGAAMFSNGDVLPCELLTDHKIGNVRDVNYDFKSLWFSEKGEEARRFIRDTKCFCTYECFLTINLLFNPAMIPAILKEWGALKIAKFREKPSPLKSN